MAVTITNRAGRSSTVHVSSANATVVVAGNTSASNLASNGETVLGGYIRQVAWGTDAGSVQIKRGGNIVATLNNTGTMNLTELGLHLTVSAAANIDVQFVGSANGFVVMDIQKQL